jgi:cytochrome c oxidase accessory protein FixG
MIKKKDESFRDHIATVDAAGKRVIMYPSKPKGQLHRARVLVSWVLLAFMFAAPFIEIAGRPLLLFNVFERKFVVFGLAFWPQDFHLFVLATITFVVFIVLFTVIFGRLWCGWACPQTVFMEMVFRKIEYWIEGNSGKQRSLDRGPWNGSKAFKKLSKHAIFLAISFAVGNIVVAYLVGVERLYQLIADGPGEHLASFVAVMAFSLITYGVFARFREQVCLIVCPYGRLQSVLLDARSIAVAYDFKRGEPRAPMALKGAERKAGDCIMCNQCVEVCPTGIDIRNGTQLECVNCTACIDACNGVMAKVGFPKGLIRYASHKGIEEGSRLKITPRIIGYSTVLVLLLTVLITLMVNRADIETSIFRTPGVMYQEIAGDQIRNLYSLKIINKTFEPMPITLRLKDHPGTITMVGGDISLPAQGLAEQAFFVDIPVSALHSAHEELIISVMAGSKLVEEVKTKFLGPRIEQHHEGSEKDNEHDGN